MKTLKKKMSSGWLVSAGLLVMLGVITAFAGIRGKSFSGSWNTEADKVLASLMAEDYESWEYATTGTDISIKALNPMAFQTVPWAHQVILRTDADITFKLNSASNHSITLTSVEGEFTFNALEITDLFVTGTANVKVILQ